MMAKKVNRSVSLPTVTVLKQIGKIRSVGPKRAAPFEDQERMLADWADGWHKPVVPLLFKNDRVDQVVAEAKLTPAEKARVAKAEQLARLRELERAISLAKQGKSDDLIRLGLAELKRQKGGRPTGSVLPKSTRTKIWPIHNAARLAVLIEFMLHYLYQDQSSQAVYDRALLLVEHIWNDKRNITVEKLDGYLSRSGTNRRRLTKRNTSAAAYLNGKT